MLQLVIPRLGIYRLSSLGDKATLPCYFMFLYVPVWWMEATLSRMFHVTRVGFTSQLHSVTGLRKLEGRYIGSRQGQVNTFHRIILMISNKFSRLFKSRVWIVFSYRSTVGLHGSSRDLTPSRRLKDSSPP